MTLRDLCTACGSLCQTLPRADEACFASLVKLVHLVAAVAMLLVGTLHVLMQLLGAQTLQTLAGDNEVEPSFPFWRCFQSHDG